MSKTRRRPAGPRSPSARATPPAGEPAVPGESAAPLGLGAGLGLATLSGALWFLACAPYDAWLLGWVAMVPLLHAVERAATPGRAALLGWWAGVVAIGGGFWWLTDVLRRFAGFPLLAAVALFFLFCAYHGVIFMGFAWAVRRIRARRGVALALLCPVIAVACERLVPEIFPYGVYITQAWHPLVLQIAELTGPLGVTALLLIANGALYELAVRRAWRPALAATGVLGLVLLLSFLRLEQVDAAVSAAPRLTVGIVQPNAAYPIDRPMSLADAVALVGGLKSQTERLVLAGAELVVWSEGAYPFSLPRDFAADQPADSPRAIRAGPPTPLIIGATTRDGRPGDAYNSALLLDRDGRVTGRYDKVRLLAFGEYVPAIETFPWLRELLPEGAGRFTAGAGPVAMTVPGRAGAVLRAAPVICYEDILPGYLRRVGGLHPDLLVNLTSDGWFGADAEPWQHLALAVFASIELRVSMVRAVNSGVSALIDPGGRVLARSYAVDPYRSPHPADGLMVSAPIVRGGDTVFAAVGNLFGDVCVVLVACALVATFRRRRNASTTD